MKKLLVLGTLLLSVAAMAESADLTAELEALNAEYQSLANQENARFDEEKAQAEAARAALQKNEKIFADLTARANKLSNEAATKFYKDQYEKLAAKYDKALKQLSQEMEQQQAVIQDFEKIKALREASN